MKVTVEEILRRRLAADALGDPRADQWCRSPRRPSTLTVALDPERREAHGRADYAPPVSSEPVDVAILGGGMAGITAALEARRRGARVMLFEPGPIGGT